MEHKDKVKRVFFAIWLGNKGGHDFIKHSFISIIFIKETNEISISDVVQSSLQMIGTRNFTQDR